MSWTLAQAALCGLGIGGGGLLILAASSTPVRARTRPRFPALRRTLDEAGQHQLPTSAFFVASAASALLAFLLAFGMVRAVPLALCLAIFAAAIPWAALRMQISRRRSVLRQVWPDVVDHLRSGIRSGLSLPEALIQLGESGPLPLRAPFQEFGRDWQAGQSMASALEELKRRLADPVGDRLVMALHITRELGGTDLGRLMGTLAEVLREAARTRGELEARQSWTVNAARIAVVAPWAVVIVLSTQPAAAEAYRGMGGMLVLGAGLVISIICYRVMRSIGALPQESRVLA